MNRDELFDAEGRYRVDSHGAPRGQPDGRDARGVARSGALSHAGRWHRRVRSPGCCLACRQPTLQRSAPWSSSSESWLRQPSPHRGDRPTDDRPPARKAAPSTLVRGVALLVDESYDGRAAPQVGQRRLEHEVVAVHPEHATLLDLAPAAVPRGDDDEPVVLPRGLRNAVPVPMTRSHLDIKWNEPVAWARGSTSWPTLAGPARVRRVRLQPDSELV